MYQNANSEPLVHTFKSPAFNGVGYSSHVLTIENLIHTRKLDIKAKQESTDREIARELENSNLNKFLRNFESRVYAELSKQLSEQLFGDDPQESGTIEILGNTIAYVTTDDTVTLTVTDADGTVTIIEIPVNSFAF
tara:strand:- start:1061 stop:1468 length:408 start_codon:yes stop_codon:yes gene_type:complete